MTETSQTPETPPESAPPKPRRLRRRKLRRSEKDVAAGGDSTDERPSRWTWPFRFMLAMWQRFSLRVFVVRIVLWGTCFVAAFLLLAYGAIRAFVKPDDLKSFLKEQVEYQTGGKFEIASVKFDVLTGIKLENVQFYPPKAGDTRGFAAGGEIDPVPLANFDALDIKYSIPRALAGRMQIKALQLVEPQFHLRKVDGKFNFESILAYRAALFPPEPEAPADPAKPEEETKEPGVGLLPFSPALIYLPFEIMAQNIGLKNLRLDMTSEEGGKITEILMTNGLNVDLGLYWFGSTMNAWVNVMSPFEKPLEVEMQAVPRDAEGKPAGDLAQTLAVKTAMHVRFSVENIKKLGVDVAVRVLSLRTPLAGFEDLGLHNKVRIVADDNYQGVTIEAMEASVADAIHYDLTGKVGVSDPQLTSVTLKLKQKFLLDLKNAATLAKPFVPGVEADGAINFDELKIDGTIEPMKLASLGTLPPDQMKEALKGVTLPYVSGVVWLEDVWAKYPPVAMTMQPISGDVSIAAGPSLSGAGSQVDIAADVVLPKVEMTQSLPVGDVTGGVENMSVKLIARALWPEMVAPIVKMNVEADGVKSSGKGLPTVDVPLVMDLDADGRQDLAKMGFTTNVELTDLAEISAMADCQSKCERFRSSVNVRLDSLEKLHAIALPAAGLVGAEQFMPTKLTGAMDFQLTARGRLPDPLATPPEELVKGADVRFNSQFNLQNVNAKVPFFNVDLKKFQTRLLTSGTMQQQKVELTNGFESVSLELPKPADKDGKPVKPTPVSVERFTFSTEVTNEIEGPIDLKAIMGQLKTDVFTKVNLGRVEAEGLLPYPMNDLRVTMFVHQEKMRDIKLDELRVTVPDYGVSSAIFVDTRVGPDFFPERLTARVKSSVALSGAEKIPGGVKTSGKIDIGLKVVSEDMKQASVEGEASFDKFNASIPGKEAGAPPLLVVEEISGQLPFKQSVALPDLKPKKPADGAPEEPKEAKPVAVAEAPATPTAPVAPAENELLPNAPLVEVEDDDAPKAAQNAKLEAAMGKYFDKSSNQLLANANLMAIADYGAVRPFFPERRPLAIKRVEAANLELSKLEFDIDLRQNWFSVNQFMIDFLGGKIQGDFQLSFDSLAAAKAGENADIVTYLRKNVLDKMRTSVHMTRLDTRKLIERFPNLKGKASGWNLLSNPYLDGTLHLAYDFRSDDMGGGLEITSIGKEQLKMMLYFIDPYEKNQALADIRGYLNIGEPRQVSVPIKNGEIDLAVDVRVLQAPLPVPKLTRVPVRQVLQNILDAKPSQEAPPPPAAEERVPTTEAEPPAPGA